MKFFGLLVATIVTCAHSADSSRRRQQPVLQSIAQTAINTPELSSLVSALQQANLVDALSGAGSFTVFAPTNDAFAAIQDTVAGLTTQQLTEVLEYHVVQNIVAKSTDLSNGQVLNPLFLHHSLSVDLFNGVRIRGETNTVTVTTADVLCSNGVVHIVNAVLIPNTPALGRTIVELAVASPMLSSLVGALQTANLVEALSGPGPFTVFAPTNDAFAAISSVVDGLTVDQLTQILENHVISGVAAKAGDLRRNEVLTSLFHESTVKIGRHGEISIEGEAATVHVIVADQICSNGVVHIVDAVLLPRYQTIVEVALAQPSLSTLVSALTTANLVDTLSGPGTFTVFAPTNDAFAAISSIVDGLTTEQLTDVLLAHVLGSEIAYQPSNSNIPRFPGSSARTPYETLFESHSVKILGRFYAGDARKRPEVAFKVISETVTAFVEVADVLCTNGIVHIVDTVLVPNAPLATIAATAASWFGGAAEDVKLSAFTAALAQASLVAPLSGDGPLTVFAPTDAAFAAISSVVSGLSLEQLTEVLEYHVIAGVAAKAADLTNGEVLQPLFDGHALTVKLERGVFIEAEGNTVQVTRTDRLCTNGVIHVVDAVLLPNLGPALNIVQTAQGNADLSTLVDALIASPGGLVATLSGTGPFTVFAPTNEAFAALAAVPTGDVLKDVLLAHVFSGSAFSTDLSDEQVVATLFGEGVTVRIANGVITLTSTGGVTARVTTPDVACSNGVVHIVDQVLVPAGLPTATPIAAPIISV